LNGTEARLTRIRGQAQQPRSHNARTIAALASNPGCARRAIMDAAGIDKQRIAECLSACEMCFLCRDEARGQTTTLGKQVREDLGSIEHVATVLNLARGIQQPEPGSDLAEAATLLRTAAAMRTEILSEAI